MSSRLDFTAYDRSGKRALVVEAKRVFDKKDSWATSWRRNFMESAGAGLAECTHMLVTPDQIFIWGARTPPEETPTHQLDARRHLEKYFRRIAIPAPEIEARAFERLVAWWLRDLTDNGAAPGEAGTAQELQRTGLLDILAGARIVEEDAA